MQFYHNFIRTRDQSARVVARDSCKRPRVRRAFNNKQLAPRFVLINIAPSREYTKIYVTRSTRPRQHRFDPRRLWTGIRLIARLIIIETKVFV